jgi:hypothetical protein
MGLARFVYSQIERNAEREVVAVLAASLVPVIVA